MVDGDGQVGDARPAIAAGSYASTRREFAPLARKPPTATIRPSSAAAATSVRGTDSDEPVTQVAAASATNVEATAPGTNARYPSQATSRITTAATAATATVTTFAIRSRVSVVGETPEPSGRPLRRRRPSGRPPLRGAR